MSTHTHIQMRFAAMAMLLFAAAGCIKENLYDPSGMTNGPTIEATIDEVTEESYETRVSISEETSATSGKIYYYWTPEDQIGVFTDASEANVCYRNTESEGKAKTATFAPTSTVAGTPTFAYYPYSADAGTNISAIKGHIPSDQIINADLVNIPGIYRYGYYKSTSGNSSSFGFKHVMSTVRFHIDVAGTPLEGCKLHNLQISVKRGSKLVPICGDFTFNAETGAHFVGSNTSNTINVSFEGQPILDSELTFYTTLFPNIQKNDVLYFTLNTAGYTATYRVSTSLTFKKNYVYTISTTIKPYSTLKITPNEIDKPDPSELPTINSFSFDVGKNSGKLLNNELKWNSSKHTPSFSSVSTHTATINNDTEEITLTIPYLYDFKLKPAFETGESNCSVFVNGIEQKSGETEVDFSKTVTYTVKNNTNGYSRDYKVKITNTGLPVVVLKHSTSGDFSKKTTGGFLGFGATTLNQFVDFWVRGKDTDWVTDDHITIYNADGTIDCEVDGGARLRGNTSQAYPKKPFALKFNEKKSVLGMPAHRRWVLLANWLDHSMIRNSVAFDIAYVMEYAWRASGGAIEAGIPWNVHGQNVELVVVDKDGDAHHVGNYLLCEQIKVDENRLNLTNGYLLEVDGNYDEPSKFKTSKNVPFMFKDEVSSTIVNEVKTKVQSIETNIYNGKFEEAYKSLDINSVVDQWLVFELAMNREYGDPRSVYMFMNDEGKLCGGPVWDFDRGTFQNQEKATELCDNSGPEGSSGKLYRIKPDNEWLCWRTWESDTYSYIWYKQLVKDPIFQKTVQTRWAVIKPYLDMIVDQIYYYGETQTVSYKYDSAMWPTTKADIRKYKSDFNDWSGDELLGANGNYQEVIENFVTVYNERLAGMDALITSGKFTK